MDASTIQELLDLAARSRVFVSMPYLEGLTPGIFNEEGRYEVVESGEVIERRHGIFKLDEAALSPLDHGGLYGDAVFEGILIVNDQVFLFKEHLSRWWRSAEKLAIGMPYTMDDLAWKIVEAIQAVGFKAGEKGYLRPVLTRGVGNLGINPAKCVSPTIYCIASTIQLYPRKAYETGIELSIAKHVRRPSREILDPNIKDKWGILRADWSRKPAWTAYRDFVIANTPVPNAGGDRTASTGVPVQFDASGSTDPHGKIVNYSWDFDHSNGVGQDATGVKASRIYAKSGTFLVTLTVTDDTGIAIGTRVKVTVSGSTQPKTYAITATPKGGVRLDGKLTEWAGAKVVNLSCTDFVRVSGSCGGDGDLYARARLMWNTGGIYLGIAVTDNVQRNTGSPGTLWSGDSIQIAFDADGGRQGPGYGAGDYEFGLALLGAQPSTERTHPQGGNPRLQLAATRNGNVTTYEALFPASGLQPLALRTGTSLGLSFLVNDDDGQGRKGWIEWTPGIGQGKDPRRFVLATLVGNPPLPPEPTPEPAPEPPAERPAIPDAGGEPMNPPDTSSPDRNTPTDHGAPADRDVSEPVPGAERDFVEPGRVDVPVAGDGDAGGCDCAGTQQGPIGGGILLVLALGIGMKARRRKGR